MARIVMASLMVRFPLGGMNNWALSFLDGFQRLGHDVYFVEKHGWPESCYDPTTNIESDDCTYGVATVGALLSRFGLGDRWCYIDAAGRYHGMSRERIDAVLAAADLFLDFTWDEWIAEGKAARVSVFLDGEPGWCQMQMQNWLDAGRDLPTFGFHYTTGLNIGTPGSSAPAAERRWRTLFPCVNLRVATDGPAPADGAFTTVMQWKSNKPVEFRGATYGQKDMEFRKFLSLPRLVTAPLEVAVSGPEIPWQQLRDCGWRTRQAMDVTMSFDSYHEYIRSSRGEFSVCKNVFVETNSGWFSERSGYYLAHGRPVVLQETGFSTHLPCGRGLFAVRTPDEAAAALDAIESDYEAHARSAREIAHEYLDSRTVLARFLAEIGF